MAKKTLLDNIIESIKDVDGRLIKQSGTTKQMISDLNYKVVEPAKSAANSAVAYANNAIESSRVNSQAIDDINSAVSDAVSDAAVARSDGLRAWNAAQSNVNLIDLNYASASAAISSARTEAIAAADEAKSSASVAQAGVVAVKSDVAAAKSDIAIAKTNLASQATSLSSYAEQASAAGKDITTLKSQAGQLEQDMADTKGNVSQLKVSASSVSATLSDAAGNISSLQATAKSYSVALSDTNSNVASVTATASELETKYADAAGDISQIKTDAKGMTQTISDAQGDIAKLKTRADGIDAKYANVAGDINTFKIDASGMKQTLINAKGDISTLQETATGFKNTLTDAQGNISTLQSDVSGLKKTTSDNAGNISTLQSTANTLTSQMSSAQGDISTLKQTASGFSSKVSGMETSLDNANSKLDGITSNGGGRNLAIGTAVKKCDLPNWGADGGQVSLDTWKSLRGQLVTISCDMSWTGFVRSDKCNNRIGYEIGLHYSDGTQLYISNWYYPTDSEVNKNFRFSRSWTLPDKELTSIDESWLYNQIVATTCVTSKLMIEKGTVAHDWSPAPEDIDAKITTNTTAIGQNKKAITLKADQKTVDKTNGTVQQLQSQLKVQADQINSKVSSSDLNAKGYVTQNYTQTQIKQTADAWNENLTSVKNGLTQSYTNLHATVDGIQAEVYNKDGSSKITQLSNVIQTKVGTDDFRDLEQTVIMQNLDSADINTMKKNGHYFVHNLANNPIGGCVYVDVTGNGNDRIRQDVYQDSGSGHKYRRWFGTSWTDWEEGATYSEINQLKDDINLRVKKGDLISQINLEAGTALIQSNKIVLDAKTTVFTGDAFIPSAAIANLTADDITTGTLKGVDIDFRNSSGKGVLIKGSKVTFDDGPAGNDAGYLSFSGIPIADWPAGTAGNELQIRYGESLAIVATSNVYSRALFSTVNTQIGYYQQGNSPSDWGLTGLKIDNSARHFNLGVWGTDSTWTRVEANTHNIQMQANGIHAWLSGNDNNFRIYRDNDGGSATATKLQVDGWAWVRGWVEAAGHSQHSALSTKTDLQTIDDDEMLEMVNNTDLASFLFKTDVASGETHRHIGLIIDDVHDVAQYQTPQDFIAPNGASRDDDNMIGALFGAVKALTKRIKTLESKVG